MPWTGKNLVDACKDHIVATMRVMPECQPGGSGAGYRLVEQVADLELGLRGQDGFMTWSLLIALAQDDRIEVVPGTEKRRKFRLR